MTTTELVLGLVGMILTVVIVVSPVALIAIWLKKRAERSGAAASYICTQCGTTGAPTKALQGSAGVELLLYMFFFIPGMIYSAWRGSGAGNTCPICKTTTMIPVDSPRGRKIVADVSTP